MILPWLMACEPVAVAEGGARHVKDFLGPEGVRIELAPADLPDDPPLHVVLGAESWAVRLGERWDDAVDVGTWEVQVTDSLRVDGHELLAEPLGTTTETAVWYGTFGETLAVTGPDGPFAGEWVFAEGIGPVVATLDGLRRECVYYAYADPAE